MKVRSTGGGIVGGLLLFILGICLLWWNEGRTARQTAFLKQAKADYVQLDSTKVVSTNENKLVALNGAMDLSNSPELVDDIFLVKAKSAKLFREVQVYQWEEECETDDNDTRTCRHNKVWSSDLNDSSSFEEKGFDNPATKIYPDRTITAENVKLGDFNVSSSLLNKLTTETVITDLPIDSIEARGLKVSPDGSGYTNVIDEANPQIGDVRIKFYKNSATNISILAVQSGDTFKSYTNKDGSKSLMEIREGNQSGAEIIAGLVRSNNIIKWLLRLCGFLMVSLGISSLFSFLTTITSRIPLLGSVVGGVVSLVAFTVGLVISFIVCAIAWFRFRPIISLILIVIALVVFVLLKFVLNKKEAVAAKK